jgi:hypothetical protein
MDSSAEFKELSKKINIFCTSIIACFGILGHFLTICIYSRKKFKKNSSHVYLYCLAINDSIFLVIHFFEDTVRTFQNVLQQPISNLNFNSNNKTEIFKQFFKFLNITDRYSLTCIVINYLRYYLRFSSAYIIIAFTVQRLIIVDSPLTNRFKSKKSGWFTVFFISIISILINSWVPFLFGLQHSKNDDFIYCDVNMTWNKEYFKIALAYIIIIILIPIIIIFICNSIIIYKTKKSDLKRKNLHAESITSSRKDITISYNHQKDTSKIIFTRSNFSTLQMNNTKTKITKNTNKITKMLVFISFSFCFLNLPYFITW